MEDAHRYLEELLLLDLEQLVARVGLQDLEQVLLVVAALVEPRALQHVADLRRTMGISKTLTLYAEKS